MMSQSSYEAFLRLPRWKQAGHRPSELKAVKELGILMETTGKPKTDSRCWELYSSWDFKLLVPNCSSPSMHNITFPTKILGKCASLYSNYRVSSSALDTVVESLRLHPDKSEFQAGSSSSTPAGSTLCCWQLGMRKQRALSMSKEGREGHRIGPLDSWCLFSSSCFFAVNLHLRKDVILDLKQNTHGPVSHWQWQCLWWP